MTGVVLGNKASKRFQCGQVLKQQWYNTMISTWLLLICNIVTIKENEKILSWQQARIQKILNLGAQQYKLSD